MTIPRLTEALRAFSIVSAPYDAREAAAEEKDIGGSLNLLAEKRRERARREKERVFTWQKFCDLIRATDGNVKGNPDVEQDLKKLHQAAEAIVGDETESEMHDSAALFLFTLFDGSAGSYVTHNNTQTLRASFGSFPAAAANEACSTVARLRSALAEDDTVERLETCIRTNSDPTSTTQTKSYFGQNIKFSVPRVCSRYTDDVALDLSWMDIEVERDTVNDVGTGSGFNMQYKKPAEGGSGRQSEGVSTEESFGMDWLLRRMEAYFGSSSVTNLGVRASELSTSVFDMLCSCKTDIELQEELFDLLGFERIELIEDILTHRQEIIAITKPSAADKSLLTALPRTELSRPTYGCQIMVQTEEEKQIQKLMRREEKRAGRGGKREESNDDNDESKFNLNHQQLRAFREAQLSAAATAPLFSQSSGHASSGHASSGHASSAQIQYPNVYDSNVAARQTSGFIGGSKLVLPLGFERISNSKYEEVNIPVNEKVPPSVRKLIPISELDEISQVAFKGAKSLNLIQSAVYNTAYNSNENMLICAPTGAGKTNIAMLTVLREIKTHLHQGVIKKDDFKIVYIAPMKALAAEMVRNFGERLAALGLTVKELTGDMQLTKAEIMKTQMLVTTPEKWDVVTRKSSGDVALTQIVRLLIIDEVHLLHDDRGSVIETLVARTLRQVESSQTMIRIVGLSATLPNYLDVARFLDVNPHSGLYFFDGRFRPVPLAQTFIGIKATQRMQQLQDFNAVCYEKVQQQVRNGHQVMVFVHARNETVRTAMVLCEMAKNSGHIMMFSPESSPKLGEALKQLDRSRNRQLRELFPDGFAIHHAGMLRQDRNLVERYFADGLVKCIVCTATLAWGVNLPAHAVIIKGTQIYDAKKGSFVDLGILDVMQIFGRAGRPQYDTYGHGTILTSHDKLNHYLSLLTQQNPIESQFINSLVDNLNAEISLGTVTNVEEGVKWLSYTYLYVRMRCNPLVYGIPHQELMNDPELEKRRRDLISEAGRKLDKAKMIRFDERTGYMFSTDNGRTASHFYVKYDTVEIFNELFNQVMSEDRVLEMISKAQEFDQIKVRDEEMEELDRHLSNDCQVTVSGGSENTYGKVNILLQTYISRASVENFSLISDQAYIVQNSSRIVRALFEMALRKNWPIMSGRLLQLSKVMEKRLWAWENPLRQFQSLPADILEKLEERGLSVARLQEMDSKEIGHMVRHVNMGSRIKECVNWIPQLNVESSIQPITRTVLRVILSVSAEFRWNDRVHGKVAEPFWIWVEDPENNHIYHSEYFLLHKKHAVSHQVQSVVFTIPIFEPLPTQYLVKVTSDRWLGSESTFPLSFRHLILPERHPPHTELLDLQPLPVSALGDKRLESLYKFSHFNPIQTQLFHILYHTDGNVLLGAPTGSGKTVAAELAIFRIFREFPGMKAVYIAPLKALVRERMEDWKVRIEERLGKRVVELTGDVTPDMRSVARADLIVTTPEKWDGISRSWQTRNYVKAVALLVIDEIHLLGDDRGPVLEVIVSRTNFISSHTERGVRVVGLSTALANAKDLADWLDIKQVGLYNFRPSVRPVPLEVHISGFPGKHYCPRMATMNKPTFQAIRTHSPDKPVLVFVSSRRQTRLTALDLIAFLAAEDDPKQWLHLPDAEMDNLIMGIRDSNLKLTLAFGIGLHHAGLHERDRKVTEELFVNQKIQVLIATSTLAWGVNFPAHLVVVKGTEYFDGKTKSYVDFPITDVLQMMGRAGRPQFDNEGKAVILVHDVKKHFYKKFLYEPFPVESNLLGVLADHLNAEIVAGTISSKQDAMDYLTWTYFFRRLVMNPSYYNLEDTSHDNINRFLSQLVQKAVQDLTASHCVQLDEDEVGVGATSMGRIASYYYLNHLTLRNFRSSLTSETRIPQLIKVLADSEEFAQLPVRHNEDQVNSDLAQQLPLPVDVLTYDSSNTKAHLLLQAHFSRLALPISDYNTDTKSVMDQAIRVCQAMLDVSAGEGWLVTTLQIVTLLQMVIQGLWSHQDPLLQLPHIHAQHLPLFRVRKEVGGGKEEEREVGMVDCLPGLMEHVEGRVERLERLVRDDQQQQQQQQQQQLLTTSQLEQIAQVLAQLPQIEVGVCVRGGPGEESSGAVTQLQLLGSSYKKREWVELVADVEYTLDIRLTRLNRQRRKDTRAHAPRFQKPKDEGWMVIVGEVEKREVVALKRVGYIHNTTRAQLTFFTPERPGRVIYTLYLMSDCYLGLDQQYELCLDIVEPRCI